MFFAKNEATKMYKHLSHWLEGSRWRNTSTL